jgi:FixJ family two-component response regulator
LKEVPIIAIVDDDDSVRRSLLRVVRSAGYEAEGFASARGFLEWLPHGRAACLLLDVHMSEMSGFDLQDRLAVPIIFITAHDDAKTQERIARSGAIGHLRKPCEEQIVLDAIRRAVHRSANQLAGPGAGPRSETQSPWFIAVDGEPRDGEPVNPEPDQHREDGGEA